MSIVSMSCRVDTNLFRKKTTKGWKSYFPDDSNHEHFSPSKESTGFKWEQVEPSVIPGSITQSRRTTAHAAETPERLLLTWSLGSKETSLCLKSLSKVRASLLEGKKEFGKTNGWGFRWNGWNEPFSVATLKRHRWLITQLTTRSPKNLEPNTQDVRVFYHCQLKKAFSHVRSFIEFLLRN